MIRCFRETAGYIRDRVEQLVRQNEALSAPLGAQLEELKDEIWKIRGLMISTASRTGVETEMDHLTTRLLEINLESDRLCRKGQILASLQLPGQLARYNNICDAHTGTFQWGFQSPDASDASDQEEEEEEEGDGEQEDTKTTIESGDFLRWLESEGEPIFWVTGKPGSGKSTFMKFVSNHSRTWEALSTWAGTPTRKIVVASHYFWSTGNEIQRSQNGLWRSLLFDILRQAPKLIPRICKDKRLELPDSEPDLCTLEPSWPINELRECLQRLADLSQHVCDIRICVFVDGLDEFESDQLDHHDLVEILLGLSKCQFIKVCVSSRPWNVFEKSLGRFPKLYMQELTRRDIQKFAEDRLTSHPSWDEILQGEEATFLVETITNRAHGVFLWVFLVTRLLREGLHNEDTFEELRDTLYSLPSDLEPFFKKMLDSVDSIYHRKMAGFLEVSAVAMESHSFEVYHFHELEYKDPDFATKEGIGQFQTPDVKKIRQRVAKRFQAFCKCLLEIDSEGRVQFLHRTVGDWLRTIPMRDFLKQKATPGFDAELSTLRAYLAWYKHPYVDHFWTDSEGVGIVIETRGKQMELLDSAFRLAHRKSSRNQDPAVHQVVCHILDDFYATTNQLFETGLLKFVYEGRSSDGLFREKLKDAQLDYYYEPKPALGKPCQSKRRMGEEPGVREVKRVR